MSPLPVYMALSSTRNMWIARALFGLSCVQCTLLYIDLSYVHSLVFHVFCWSCLGVYQGPLYWLIPGISHLKFLVLCLPQPTLQTQATWVVGFPCLCVCVQPLVSFLFLFCFLLCMTWPPFKHLQPWILPLWAFLTLLQPYWTIFLIYPGLYTAFFSVWNFIFFNLFFYWRIIAL